MPRKDKDVQQPSDKEVMAKDEVKQVALIGSTGGGSASLAGGEGLGLITAITRQLKRAGIEVVAIQLVESTVRKIVVDRRGRREGSHHLFRPTMT